MATNPISKKVRNSLAALGIKGPAGQLADRVKDLTTETLGKWKCLNVTHHDDGLGMESFTSVVERSRTFDLDRDGDAPALVAGLKELGMSDRHIGPVAQQCLDLFDKKYNAREILSPTPTSDKFIPLSSVVGRTAAARNMGMESVGMEAFGDDINRLATDDRLTMDLMIMRPWDSLLDKVLARVSESSPIVTVRVPSPEAWDWTKTQEANSTVDSRSGPSNTYRLRDLYRNPTNVNSAPKQIIPLAANDSNGVMFNVNNAAATGYYKTGKDVSLLDLSRNQAVFTYDRVDRTDLVADGGYIQSILVDVTDNSGDSPVTETFSLQTRAMDLSLFVLNPSNKNSGARQVILPCSLIIEGASTSTNADGSTVTNAATTQYDGTASTIAAKLTDAKVQIDLRFNATLNIQNGLLEGSGSANLKLQSISGAAAPSADTQTLFGKLDAAISGYNPYVCFDEENQRKANLAIWVQYYEQQFVVPRSRIYFTDYQLVQDVDQNAVAATSSIVALGNGIRGLGIIVDALNDTAAGLSYAESNPELASINGIDEQSFASALVKPTVITSTLDFEATPPATMNESTRLTELHGMFRARLLSMATMLMAKSLMLNQYKAGQTVVLKGLVHSTIADTIIGILDWNKALDDKVATAVGADYSMMLPNGYRLDIAKTNFDCMQGRLYVVPVMEDDPASILSACSIRDCGTVTTNYTPTYNAAVVRRVATTTREIVMMSNKVGMCMIVKNLQSQLGPFGYDQVPLNAPFSENIMD